MRNTGSIGSQNLLSVVEILPEVIGDKAWLIDLLGKK
jgi:hypothetical protein